MVEVFLDQQSLGIRKNLEAAGVTVHDDSEIRGTSDTRIGVPDDQILEYLSTHKNLRLLTKDRGLAKKGKGRGLDIVLIDETEAVADAALRALALNSKKELPKNWEVEYQQLSEDFRHYVSDGWQVPIALLAVDGLVAGAVWNIPSKLVGGFVLLLSGVMTVLLELEMIKWNLRTKGRVKALKDYARFPENNFTRFADNENWFLRLRIGYAFVGIMLLLGAGLIVLSYLFLTGAIP